MKQDKVKILFFACMLMFLTSFTKVSAYEFNTSNPYVLINVQGVGQVRLHVASNQENLLFKTSNNQIGNCSTSSITFYTNDNNYTWNISTYDSLRYRTANNVNYIYPNYTIIDSNISTLDDAQNFVIRYKDLLMIFLEFIIAMGVLLRWLKH